MWLSVSFRFAYFDFPSDRKSGDQKKCRLMDFGEFPHFFSRVINAPHYTDSPDAVFFESISAPYSSDRPVYYVSPDCSQGPSVPLPRRAVIPSESAGRVWESPQGLPRALKAAFFGVALRISLGLRIRVCGARVMRRSRHPRVVVFHLWPTRVGSWGSTPYI